MPSPACSLARRIAASTPSVQNVYGASGSRPAVGRLLACGHDEHVVADDGLATPAVHEVEQVTADHLTPDVGEVEVGGRLLPTLVGVLGIVEVSSTSAGLVPVEDRPGMSSGRAMYAVERGDCLDDDAWP